MNCGAVITYEDKMRKSPVLGTAAEFVVIDPSYTMTVPAIQVFSGAFDTLSHAMETYFGSSDKDNVSDDIALAVMRNTAVIHPAYYRHILKDAPDKFGRFAKTVFGVDTAKAGIDALKEFIKECGLPAKLSELKSRVEITPDILRKVSDTCNIIKCNPRELNRDEIYDILTECL